MEGWYPIIGCRTASGEHLAVELSMVEFAGETDAVGLVQTTIVTPAEVREQDPNVVGRSL